MSDQRNPPRPATGIVHLGDLANHYVWDEPQLPRYLEWLGLALDDQQITSIIPPERLVVFCNCTQLQLLAQFKLWMSSCSNVYFWISFEDSPTQWQNMETRRQITLEAGKLARGVALSCLRHFSEEFTASQADEIRAMLNGTGIYSNDSEASDNFPVRPKPLSDKSAFNSGPWCRLEKHSFNDPELIWPRQIGLFQGRPSILLPQQAQLIRLDDGSLEPHVNPNLPNQGISASTPEVEAPFPEDGGLRNINLRNDVIPQSSTPVGDIIGLWPSAPAESVQLGWAGGRCVFDWLLVRSGQIGFLSGCEHDWPCGHEKKQYGFLDNEPCWVQLSRDASCYLSVYQKDAIVNDRVPVGWTRCGSIWAACCDMSSSPHRALFFCHDQTDNWDGNPLDPHDGDARMIRPAIVLGPDQNFRYALDLSRPVYRIQEKCSQLVSGAPSRAPESSSTGHFGVYSSEHQLRRLGSGRLLGGWDRWLTVLKNGRLRREEIDSGKSAELGVEEREIHWAFSLPGTPNVVLVHQQEEFVEVRLV